MHIFLKAWKPITLLLLAGITVASLIPLPELPVLPGKDKAHHLLAYSILAFPVSLSRPNRYWLYLILFFLWSGVIEILQPFANRYGEPLDLLANGVGILLGFLLAVLVRWALARHLPD